MPNNTGFMLLAGLGALLFLGRGGVPKAIDEDNLFLGDLRGGGPMPPPRAPFDIQTYVDNLFRDTATAPVQPPMRFFYPPPVIVTSSGVPAVTVTAPDLITATTKVAIGGDGGETIIASALAVKRTEQIKQQRFEEAANVQPRTWAVTAETNRIEEARQKKFAADLIAKNIAAQAGTREQQEAASRKVADIPPTINFDFNDDDWSINPFTTPGQPIEVAGEPDIDVDFTPEYTETFVISGGMDSPMVFAGEEEDTFSLSGVQDYGYGVYYGGGEDE